MSRARPSHGRGRGHQQPPRQRSAAAFVLLLRHAQQPSHEAAKWSSSLAVVLVRHQPSRFQGKLDLLKKLNPYTNKRVADEEMKVQEVQQAYENLKYGEKRTLHD
ncbi:hypothetical protein ZWY2020_011522 [Hordeum vulgare]|nr:hypothetical protein ZWY2020_011522 [Hordeum vulgare]